MTTLLATTTTSTLITSTAFDPITSWDAIRAPASIAQTRARAEVDPEA